jgi:mRNA interferase MazF
MVNKWSIHWAQLNPTRGSEQAGRRPVLIISNNHANEILPNVTVIPISSITESAKIYPTEVYLSPDVSSLPKPSVAMIHQIRTVSKVRLESMCGVIENEAVKAEIHQTMIRYFDL